ncbi:hypothetical protein ATK17_1856 [Branchiibius hedensis]|uniref:MYXO-CTERM domain-containing protein n=1 Tax=Branchiibius hedensis TaxID=672460 RepID=A0A2Y9C1L4_9MICO|nr:hypothetical protein [Branchiibius hedensis]PWJ25720.1 hypothetical protein ATK17_1856 [Branchiibius hedensis]SSA34533.1 hypothetical protein SAMN04489750_1856 [Branchiibius hedensis]
MSDDNIPRRPSANEEIGDLMAGPGRWISGIALIVLSVVLLVLLVRSIL